MEANYENVLQKTRERFLGLMELNNENKWELFESYKDGITVHTKLNPENGYKINRAQTVMPFTPEQILSVVSDPSHRSNYDDKFEGSQVLKKLDQNSLIQRSRIKSPAMLVSARDVVAIQRIYQENGNTLIISTSIEYPDCPVDKNYVRANLVIAGWYLKPLPDGKTEVVAISHNDPKGSIPSVIINQAPKFQADLIRSLMQYIAKQKK